MAELVHHRDLDLVDRNGEAYDRVFVYAEPLPYGAWQGWLEFVSRNGATVLQSDRETTQSTLEGVAYWAAGLQPTYLEGALGRALARRSEPRSNAARSSPGTGGGAVRLRLVSVDPSVPFRLMTTRTLVPGVRRHIHNGGVILYRGRLNGSARDEPGIYEFDVQFGSDNAAGILANRLWNDLHGLGARIEIGGEAVSIENSAIKDALLAAQPTT